MTPFGEYLEQLRRDRYLQQKQLADIMGINPCYVSALEKGRKGPPSKLVLEQLVEKLNLSQEEENGLWRSVELSDLNLRLPKNMTKQEFEFLYELRKNLGRLSQNQLVIMQTALRMGESVVGQVQRRSNAM
jgi:HTH-type transcriptional regulator, competence development regulator